MQNKLKIETLAFLSCMFIKSACRTWHTGCGGGTLHYLFYVKNVPRTGFLVVFCTQSFHWTCRSILWWTFIYLLWTLFHYKQFRYNLLQRLPLNEVKMGKLRIIHFFFIGILTYLFLFVRLLFYTYHVFPNIRNITSQSQRFCIIPVLFSPGCPGH